MTLFDTELQNVSFFVEDILPMMYNSSQVASFAMCRIGIRHKSRNPERQGLIEADWRVEDPWLPARYNVWF